MKLVHLHRCSVLALCLALLGCPAPHAVLQSPSAPMPSATQTLTQIAFGSCATQREPQPIWKTIANTNPEVFLFIGDNVYGDVESADPALPELREAYAALGARADFDAFQADFPILPIWDDHDYGLNDGGAEFALKKESKGLFVKFWDIKRNDPRRQREGLYHSWTFGQGDKRVQILLLDTRYFRSPFVPTDDRGAKGKERYVPSKDGKGTILGDAQWAWLEKELRKPATLRLVVSSYQVLADDHGFEAWRHLPHERTRLLDLITATKANGVVLLSGDRHIGALYADTAQPYPIYELTSSSLNRPFGATPEATGAPMIGSTFTEANFGLIQVDWDAKTVTLELRDIEGNVGLTKTLSVPQLQHP